MEYNKLIAEMSLSDEVEGFYVLKSAYPKTTTTGKPFLSASLSDRSGSIEIKVVPSCFGVQELMVTGVRTLFDIYTNKCSPLPEWMKAFAFMT